MTHTKTTLEALPNELLQSIIGHLYITDALNLNLVNKRLYGVTLDRIYQKFGSTLVLEFLQTIACTAPHDQRNLAKRVKHVTWLMSDGHNKASISRQLTTSEKQALVQAYRRLSLANPSQSSEDHVLDAVFARHSTAYFARAHLFVELLVSFLPNIKKLILKNQSRWDYHTYWFKHISANANRFDSLETIHVAGPLRIENITPLLTLPALKILELSSVYVLQQEEGKEFEWENEEQFISLPDKSSGIERLVFYNSYIPTSSLADIIRVTRSLKIFKYAHMMNYKLTRPGYGHVPVDYEMLTRALHRHSATLEWLQLIGQRVYNKQVDLDIVCTFKLQKLNLRIAGEVTVDLLFSSLQHTTIEACVDNLFPTGIEALTVLVKSKAVASCLVANWVPERAAVWIRALARRGLRSVIVSVRCAGNQFTGTPTEDAVWKDMAVALEKVGVGFQRIIKRHREDDYDYG